MILIYIKVQTYSVYIRGQLQNGGKNVRVNARELAGFGLLSAAPDHEQSYRVEELARR